MSHSEFLLAKRLRSRRAGKKPARQPPPSSDDDTDDSASPAPSQLRPHPAALKRAAQHGKAQGFQFVKDLNAIREKMALDIEPAEDEDRRTPITALAPHLPWALVQQVDEAFNIVDPDIPNAARQITISGAKSNKASNISL